MISLPILSDSYPLLLSNSGIVMDIFAQVEAGEKKKKKTGRAKRRIQYNRRFVNVVETFGRKKGPNANS